MKSPSSEPAKFDLAAFQANQRSLGRPADPSLADSLPLGLGLLTRNALPKSGWDRRKSSRVLVQYFSSIEYGGDPIASSMGWSSPVAALMSWMLSIHLLKGRYAERVLVTDIKGTNLALSMRLPYTRIIPALTPLDSVGRCPVGLGKLLALSTVAGMFPEAVMVGTDVHVIGELGIPAFLSLDAPLLPSRRYRSIDFAAAQVSAALKNAPPTEGTWEAFLGVRDSGYMDTGIMAVPEGPFQSLWMYWVSRNPKLMAIQEAAVDVPGFIEQSFLHPALRIFSKPMVGRVSDSAFADAGIVRWNGPSKKNPKATNTLLQFCENSFAEEATLVHKALG